MDWSTHSDLVNPITSSKEHLEYCTHHLLIRTCHPLALSCDVKSIATASGVPDRTILLTRLYGNFFFLMSGIFILSFPFFQVP